MLPPKGFGKSFESVAVFPVVKNPLLKETVDVIDANTAIWVVGDGIGLRSQ